MGNNPSAPITHSLFLRAKSPSFLFFLCHAKAHKSVFFYSPFAAAKKMEKLPGETADAVRGALSDLSLYIDGRSVTAVISEIQASYVLNNP